MKKFRSTIIALSILLIIGFIFLIINPIQKQKQKKLRGKLQVLKVDKNAILSIQFEKFRRGFTLTRMKDPDVHHPLGFWEITEPSPLTLEEREIDGLLQLFSLFMARAWITNEPRSLDEFGLAKPRLTLTIKGNDFSHKIFFGNRTQNRSNYYVKTNQGVTIYAVSQKIYDLLDRPLKSFRSRKILTFDAEKIVTISLKGPNLNLKAQKNPANHRWGVSLNNKQHKANPQGINRILKGLGNIRVHDFVADHTTSRDILNFGLKNPDREILLTSESGEAFGLLISKKKNFDKNPNLIYVINKDGRFIYSIFRFFIDRTYEHPKQLIESSN